MLETKTVTNGPFAEYVERVCHDTLPWLISFSLDEIHNTLRGFCVFFFPHCDDK